MKVKEMTNICDKCKNRNICLARQRIDRFEEFGFSKRDENYYKEELFNIMKRDYSVEIDINGAIKVISCQREEKRL